MRGMNGSTGASPENRGYPGGIPGPGQGPGGMGPGSMGLGMTPGGTPVMGLHGHAGAAASAAAAAMGLGSLGGGNLELKHHADFLSRLLAATPSYMSEMGNPPPGFFSDWLRRLVSKPSGNSGSLQTSGLTFPGGQPEAESSGGRPGTAAIPSTTPSQLDTQSSSKRRKRSRLNDHPEHPLGGSSTNELDRPTSGSASGHGHGHHLPSSAASSLNQPPMTSTVSSMPNSASPPSSAAAAAAAAAAAFPSLGAYPFWFFPPFLPNPYGMGMNMGMNFPGHPTPNSPGAGQGLSAAAQAAAISSYLGGASPSDLFRTDNLNLLSGSITATGGGGRANSANSPHSMPHPFPPPQSMDGNHLHPHHGNSHPHLAKLAATSRLLESSGGKGKESPPVRSPLLKDSPSFLAAAAAAASASFLLNSGSGASNAHSKANNQLPSPSSHYSNNHNGLHHKMTAKSPPSSNQAGGGSNSGPKSNNNKSSSFSISRLTSPSPSSNSSSGGSCSGSNLGNSKYHGGHHHHRAGHRNSSSSYEDIKPHPPQQHQSYNPRSEESVLKSNLNSGPKMSKDAGGNGPNSSASGDAGLCVDLRVSGRIWESSGVVPAPRSIYTPLSAFRDPADVNLYNSSRSSPQVPRYDPHHHTTTADYPIPPPPTTLSLLQQKTPLSGYPATPISNALLPPSGKNLSTKYVLRNIQHIYQRIHPTPSSSPGGSGGRSTTNNTGSGSGSPNPNQITTSHPINNHHSPPVSATTNARSPLSQSHQQSSINHHHSLHSDNKNTPHKSKKTSNTNTNGGRNNTTITPQESEDEDNSVIIPDSRSHSSSSSILDDDDFKPEAELKMAIKDNTLNLTLNNNNVEKDGDADVDTKTKPEKVEIEEKVRRKSTELESTRTPPTKKRKSSPNQTPMDDEFKFEKVDNPYNFVDLDEVKPKSKKVKKENNNESFDEDDNSCGASSHKKAKVVVSKVKNENFEEQEDSKSINVSEQDTEEQQTQEC